MLQDAVILAVVMLVMGLTFLAVFPLEDPSAFPTIEPSRPQPTSPSAQPSVPRSSAPSEAPAVPDELPLLSQGQRVVEWLASRLNADTLQQAWAEVSHTLAVCAKEGQRVVEWLASRLNADTLQQAWAEVSHTLAVCAKEGQRVVEWLASRLNADTLQQAWAEVSHTLAVCAKEVWGMLCRHPYAATFGLVVAVRAWFLVRRRHHRAEALVPLLGLSASPDRCTAGRERSECLTSKEPRQSHKEITALRKELGSTRMQLKNEQECNASLVRRLQEHTAAILRERSECLKLSSQELLQNRQEITALRKELDTTRTQLREQQESNAALASRLQEHTMAIDLLRPGTVPPCFVCPITQEMMCDPCITPSGHSYERLALERWIRDKGIEPQTRLPLTPGQVFPNRGLKDAIAVWRGRGPLLPR
eukprot:EG_transcript_11095